MLSVINRGSVTTGTDGIPFKIVNGYMPFTTTQKLSGIPTPINVELEPIIKNGCLPTQTPIVSSQELISVTVTPVIKNGYTPLNIQPEE